jgi:hypothetical protein
MGAIVVVVLVLEVVDVATGAAVVVVVAGVASPNNEHPDRAPTTISAGQRGPIW